MDKSISFLLGAGFSAPIGFPIGEELGDEILNESCKIIDEFNRSFHWGNDDGPRVLKELTRFYKTEYKTLDYEDLFDKIEDYLNDEYFKYHIKNLIREEPTVRSIKSVYQYLIYFILNRIKIDDSVTKYGNFLLALNDLLRENDEINIHSLNHDLLFESFRMSSLIGDEICDGYEKENSIYKVNGKFKIPYYSGIYNKKIRLYKMHGSIDQYKYFNQSGDVSIYVKIDNSSYHDDIHKYSKMGEQIDTYIPANREPRFLTGDIMKTKSLREDYFEKLMTRFEENLEQSDYLIIIGYGAKDKEINKRIKTHFDYKNKPCYIWDLNPGGVLKKFAAEINALPIIEDSVTNFKLPTAINC